MKSIVYRTIFVPVQRKYLSMNERLFPFWGSTPDVELPNCLDISFGKINIPGPSFTVGDALAGTVWYSYIATMDNSYIAISVDDLVIGGPARAPLVYIYHGNCGNLRCDMMMYDAFIFCNSVDCTARRRIHFRAVNRMTYYIAVSTTDIDVDPSMSIYSTTTRNDIGSSCESARNLTNHCFDDEIDCHRRAEHFLHFEVSDAQSGENNIVVPECTEEEPSAGNGEEEGDDNPNSSVAWFLLDGVGLSEHIVLDLWYSCPAVPSEPSIRFTLYQGSDCENLVCRNDIFNKYQKCFEECAPTNDDTWFGSQGCYCYHEYENAAEIEQ